MNVRSGWVNRIFEDIIKFYNKTKSEGKSPSKLFSKFDSTEKYYNAMKEKYGEYNINILLYSTYNNLDSVPLAPCGSIKKFSGLTCRNVCNNYKSNNRESCPICHDNLKLLINENRKKSVLEKYGVDSVSKVKSIRDKANTTNLKKYGCSNVSKNEDIKKLKKKTFEKYKNNDNFLIEKSYPFSRNRCVNIENYCEETQKFELTYISFIRSEKHSFKCNRCGTPFDVYNYHSNSSIVCPKCDHQTISKFELEVREYISSICSDEIIFSDRKILGGLEIDIYIPSKKICIEANGIYWHSTKKRDDKNYHFNKSKLAEDKGLNLIHIYEDEWYFNTDMIKKRLSSLIVNTSEKISARKCMVKKLDTLEERDFINNNHIQGYVSSKICYGLYYNDVLVSAMSFSKPRYNKKYEYELLRFCSSCNVRGAFSKLLKHFERTHKPSSLLSYADYDWSIGNVYKINGFEFQYYSKPGYFYSYFKKNQYFRISRYECQKHKLLEKYKWATKDMTELEICNILGYNKIYNSGNMVFVKTY